VAPPEEPVYRALVGLPGICVRDPRLEEIGVSVLGLRPGVVDDRRRRDLSAEAFEIVLADQESVRRNDDCGKPSDSLWFSSMAPPARFCVLPNNVLYSAIAQGRREGRGVTLEIYLAHFVGDYLALRDVAPPAA